MHCEQSPRMSLESNLNTLPVDLKISTFMGSCGTEEFHIVLKPTEYASFSQQLDWLELSLSEALRAHSIGQHDTVFRRFFCSDLPNQICTLNKKNFSNPELEQMAAISLVNQPPVGAAKVSLWVYCIKGSEQNKQRSKVGTSLSVKRGELTHVWTSGLAFPNAGSSFVQTHRIFEAYHRELTEACMSLKENVIRTWFFVKNVDSNYAGLVDARNEVFAKHDLTRHTHYIASTGIEGGHSSIGANVLMDAYAIKGVKSEQIEYLHALDHLGHTHAYGVTFERATSVAYNDRKHIFISGTASIDPQGNIVHEGDVLSQLDRTLENISALLIRASASIKDMQHFIVYVRDPSDAEFVWEQMKYKVGDKPYLVVTAPVCRPGWLIEIEGIAVVAYEDPKLPAF